MFAYYIHYPIINSVQDLYGWPIINKCVNYIRIRLHLFYLIYIYFVEPQGKCAQVFRKTNLS